MWHVLSRFRYLSIIAVISSLFGSGLLFFIGAAKTAKAFMYYTGIAPLDPHLSRLNSSDVAIVYLVRSLDAFLIGLALLIFAYGVYTLFCTAIERPKLTIPGLPEIPSVSFLKHILGEVVVVIIFVITLEEVLMRLDTLNWQILVLPVIVLLLSLSLKFLKMREH